MGKVWGPDAVAKQPVDLALRQHRLARRVAARRGPALRRHRRRPGPGHRGRRPDLAPPGQLPRRAGAAATSATSSPRASTRTSSTPPSTTTRAATSSPTCSRAPTAAAPGPRSRPTCPRAAPPGRIAEDTAHHGAALRRHRVRPLLLEGRRREVGAPQGRPADDPRARPRDPEARGRPRDRHLRARLLRPRRPHAAPRRDARAARERGRDLPGQEGARLHPADPARPQGQGVPRRDPLHRAQPARSAPSSPTT